jgi:hypothetical protein
MVSPLEEILLEPALSALKLIGGSARVHSETLPVEK